MKRRMILILLKLSSVALWVKWALLPVSRGVQDLSVEYLGYGWTIALQVPALVLINALGAIGLYCLLKRFCSAFLPEPDCPEPVRRIVTRLSREEAMRYGIDPDVDETVVVGEEYTYA